MSPLSSKTLVSADSLYDSPFIKLIATGVVTVDVSGLTTDEVDADGYIKPGVPLKSDGTLVAATETEMFGVVVEATKIPDADDNLAATLGAATDFQLAVAVYAVVNRAVTEDILGRVLTADELTAFGNSTLVLQQ